MARMTRQSMTAYGTPLCETVVEAPRYPAHAATLTRVVALAFGQRRKMLRASLRPLGPDAGALLEAAGVAPTDRAEQVPLEAFCRLSRLVAERGYSA